MLLFALYVQPAQGASEEPVGMVMIPAGTPVSLFEKEESDQETVKAFFLDAHPVTVDRFRKFVELNPEWRKSAAKPVFVEASYLANWKSDLNPDLPPAAPVTYVSWFAARAYCKAQHKRLPSLKEWELAGAASDTAPDGRSDPKFLARILQWYSRPQDPQESFTVGRNRNFFGVYDLHGLVWEWVSDFNSSLVTGESRADGEVNERFCGAGALNASEKDRANYAAFMRYAFRSSLSGRYALANLGFRCAKDKE